MFLLAHDCFELARHAYNQADYYHTVMWMEEALEHTEEAPRTQENLMFKALVLDYLAYSLSMVRPSISNISLVACFNGYSPNGGA